MTTTQKNSEVCGPMIMEDDCVSVNSSSFPKPLLCLEEHDEMKMASPQTSLSENEHNDAPDLQMAGNAYFSLRFPAISMRWILVTGVSFIVIYAGVQLRAHFKINGTLKLETQIESPAHTGQ